MQNTLVANFAVQLWLAALAMAAPVEQQITAQKTDAWQYGTGGGIVGLFVLVVDILVFLEVLKSNRAPLQKILWSLLVFFFPIGGLLIYLLFSNRKAHNSGSGYEALP
ncbi:hypothetical protein B0T22DRAFT_482224 [Podospora appendiculata]|uniref:Cardiolipin synthase N-terminal domain-containing protein n=1 Tax=Podospora appendiculata TaxID=314037 RepID=A0AAE0X5E2_9PEZI|nr:hypothetical protein B0T22DRAFT_482224 [Podospora appendiculata]